MIYLLKIGDDDEKKKKTLPILNNKTYYLLVPPQLLGASLLVSHARCAPTRAVRSVASPTHARDAENCRLQE